MAEYINDSVFNEEAIRRQMEQILEMQRLNENYRTGISPDMLGQRQAREQQIVNPTVWAQIPRQDISLDEVQATLQYYLYRRQNERRDQYMEQNINQYLAGIDPYHNPRGINPYENLYRDDEEDDQFIK